MIEGPILPIFMKLKSKHFSINKKGQDCVVYELEATFNNPSPSGPLSVEKIKRSVSPVCRGWVDEVGKKKPSNHSGAMMDQLGNVEAD